MGGDSTQEGYIEEVLPQRTLEHYRPGKVMPEWNDGEATLCCFENQCDEIAGSMSPSFVLSIYYG